MRSSWSSWVCSHLRWSRAASCLRPAGALGLFWNHDLASDLSQRELVIATGLSGSWVARVEAGATVPRVAQLEAVLALAGWRLAVLDERRREIHPLLEYDGDLRDGAGRRYPAHLDAVIDPERDEWWAGWYGLARPPETFRRNRWARDRQRARSQFELGRRARRQQGW